MNPTIALLQEGRRRELAQALFYRHLAGDAEHASDAPACDRLNELLADEQHHVSRLTARILELGGTPEDCAATLDPVPALDAWEATARAREDEEVAWYVDAVTRADDPKTRAVLQEILDSERHHREGLAGKWMPAGPTTAEEDM